MLDIIFHFLMYNIILTPKAESGLCMKLKIIYLLIIVVQEAGRRR